MDSTKLFAVLPTFRRPALLAQVLESVSNQTRPIDHLVVVDNDPTAETRSIVDGCGLSATYLPSPENLGFCGGVRLGMQRALADAEDTDWIVVFDDDDPPPSDDIFEELERFGARMSSIDPRTGAVGLVGARFDWKKGGIARVTDSELSGAVPVDFIGGNHFPFYVVGAIRDAGAFSDRIFFGLSEVEHGLRLREAGYSIYAHGDMWRTRREAMGRMGLETSQSLRLPALNWRRYYSLRNSIYILRAHDHTTTALKVTLTKGVLKPGVNLARHPRDAVRHLALNLRACRDGWTGRMGRTIEPDGLARP